MSPNVDKKYRSKYYIVLNLYKLIKNIEMFNIRKKGLSKYRKFSPTRPDKNVNHGRSPYFVKTHPFPLFFKFFEEERFFQLRKNNCNLYKYFS